MSYSDDIKKKALWGGSRFVCSNNLMPYTESQVKNIVRKYQIPYDKADGSYVFLLKDWEDAIKRNLKNIGQRRISRALKSKKKKATEDENG